MEDLPIAGALVWVQYTPLNCYWPCVVEKYNEDKVKPGHLLSSEFVSCRFLASYCVRYMLYMLVSS